MKLNRKLVMVLALVLSLALATGGTLAYLTDTDKDVNVMTLGNVKIEQHEYQRVVNEDGTFATDTIDDRTSYVLEDFEQGKPLFPSAVPTNGEGWDYDSTPIRMSQVDSYGGMSPFVAASNAQDKIVTVENTGKSDAYVRTLIAFEIGTADFELLGINHHAGAWNINHIGVIQVEGLNYYLIEYVYNGAQLSDGSWRHPNGVLPAGDTTYPSLAQVYLSSEATNEDMEAIDGNGNGLLDILVVSQAIQTAGFSDAETALNTGFGVVSANSHPWMDGKEGDQEPDETVVTSDEELLAAIQDADVTDIVIKGDLTYDWGGNSYANSEALLLKGKTIRGAGLDSSITFKGYGSANPIVDVTFENITIKDETVGDDESSWEHGYLEFEGLTAKNVVFADPIMLAGNNTLTNCSVDNQQASWYGAWVEGGNTYFNNCTFTGTRAIKIHEAYGSDVASVTVKNCSFTLSEKPGVVIGNLNAGTAVAITGSTFDTQPGDQSKHIYESDTDITTFAFFESGNTVK